ncbi:P2R1A-PPP2R2A-interacting phosphatase regulator 1-like [Castor canadensis]|uniref:P2R1A-PPP2R2A-interacting phosphatase regulator 1-like n=1 Tax=Castor canadensis TaxID=51338 RepID=A0AC58LQ23_CASCN
MAQEEMEVDLGLLQSPTITEGSILKRSNSVPLMNGYGDNSQVFLADTLRSRRNSTMFMNRHVLLFLPSIRTSASRLHQIKQEECMDLTSREAMHEREVHTAMQICQSWETSLNLNGNNLEKPSSVRGIDLIPVSSATSLSKKIGKNSQAHQHC